MVGGFAIVMIPDLHQLTPEIRALATRVCEGLHEARALFEADGPQRGHVPVGVHFRMLAGNVLVQRKNLWIGADQAPRSSHRMAVVP